MFDEMRAFAAKHESVSPEIILKMATVNGARAIGQQGKLGELERGALADIIGLPFTGDVGEVFSAVIQHKGAVTASLIGGVWAIDHPASRA